MACLIVLTLIAPPAAAQSAQPDVAFRSIAVDVTFAESAYIEWNYPISAPNREELALIATLFRIGIEEAIEGRSGGVLDAVLKVEVERFDILSRLEVLFCCARNEVSAAFELIDAASGVVIKPRETLNFDHIGRGGVIGLLSASGGQDQLSYLQDIIRDGTWRWLSETR